MKAILIFPPYWGIASNPHLSLPTLAGFLRPRGIEVEQLDLNIEFLNYLFSEEYLLKISKKLDEKLYQIKYKENFASEQEKENLIISRKLLDFIYKKVQNASYGLKHFKPDVTKSFFTEFVIVEYIAFILSSLYAPSKISFVAWEYETEFIKKNHLTLEGVYKSVYDDKDNLFLDFYHDTLSRHLHRFTDSCLVGISISSCSQVIPAFTLARAIRKFAGDMPIVIGGAMTPYMYDGFFRFSTAFNLIDYVIVGEGELPLLQLMDSLESNKSLLDVSRLIFEENGTVVATQKNDVLEAKNFPMPDFSDYDFSLYFSPKIIIPYLMSRGCYWRNCKFCTLPSSYTGPYREKPIENVISELKILCSRFACRHFDFVDQCISPKRMEELSLAIERERLRISWMGLARCEEGFSKKLLKNAFNSGCRLISWGFESGSQKVLNEMGKGILINNVTKVLESSHSAGIWNHVFVILGFPGETKRDRDMTLEFLLNNEYIDSLNHALFVLEKGSYVYSHPSEFHIIIDNVEPTYCDPSYTFVYQKGTKRSIIFKQFEAKIVSHHFCSHNFEGYDGARMLLFLSVNKKNPLKKFFKEQITNALIRNGYVAIERVDWGLNRGTIWTSSFSLPSYPVRKQFRAGFNIQNCTFVVLENNFVKHLFSMNKQWFLSDTNNLKLLKKLLKIRFLEAKLK